MPECELDREKAELKPLGPHHRGNEVDESQSGNNASDVDHGVLLNFFAGEQKQTTKAEAGQTKYESERNPRDEIHS